MRMPPPQWQVEGLLPENSLCVLYGPSGCGKSFVSIDLALSVGSGLRWQGRQTTKGFVLYVSAEGRAGLGQRIKAWMIDRTLESRDVDIAWLPEAIDIYGDSAHIDVLFERMEEMDRAPDLVIIDTLARCFVGDESKTEDMSNFVRGCDRIKTGFATTVLAIHHTNTEQARERGNGALRGATDAMICMSAGVLGSKAPSPFDISHDKTFTMTVSKQKEAPEDVLGVGRLRQVEGTRSCVADIEWVQRNDR
jgi:RecA-family ATPase